MRRSAGWLAVGMFAVALAGCGGSGATALRAHKAPPTTLSARSVEDEQIVTAWKAAAEAFDNASLTSDYNSPALEATFANPLLSILRSRLYSWHLLDYSARGSNEIIAPRLLSVRGNIAAVKACIIGNEIEELASGLPVPGPLGKADKVQVHASLILVDNVWKVTSQTVKDVASC